MNRGNMIGDVELNQAGLGLETLARVIVKSTKYTQELLDYPTQGLYAKLFF